MVIPLLTELVRINSINPALAPGAPGEAVIARYIAETLRHSNVSVQLLEPEPGRVSVVATVKGTGGGRSLMLNGHIDTVAVDGTAWAGTAPAKMDNIPERATAKTLMHRWSLMPSSMDCRRRFRQ